MAIAFKNPLSQAFGLALRKERVRLGLSVNEIARAIGIKASFLNLIEQGSNFLHVNKSAMVVEAFEESNFCLDGVMKVLMVISMMEAAAREMLDAHQDKEINYKQLYFEGLSAAIDKLSAHDEEKLGRLLSAFDINNFSSLTPKGAAKLIEDNELDIEVLKFLKNYETYGSTPAEATNFLSKRIHTEIPTIYFDFINDFIDGLVNLPVRINFQEMWRWEDRNRNNFEAAIGYVSKKELVISHGNLNRYHYNYLWEPGFKKVEILVEGNSNSSDLKDDFVQIFKKRLEESVDKSCSDEFIIKDAEFKLKSFSKAMDKIKFNSITLQDKSILAHQDHPEERFVGVWVFHFKNSSIVGSMALETKDDDIKTNYQERVKEGINLNFSVAYEKDQLLNLLWKSTENG